MLREGRKSIFCCAASSPARRRSRCALFGTCIVVLTAVLGVARVADAATNISAVTTEHWAWNDVAKWMDFYNTNTVVLTSQKLTGYASSSIGDISLDCATTRNGNICSQGSYGVTNDGAGSLSGWGWNDTVGWISFDCANHGGCVPSYRVYVDESGFFQNYAWNDVVGWISFNCANTGGCATSNYKVVTSWIPTPLTGYLDSTTFDTQRALGVQLNAVIWHGAQPVGTSVRFQFAGSNASGGPWSFIGPDGTGNSYYDVGQNIPLRLDYSFHNNQRYFRYRITLVSNQTQTLTPRVDDVIVSWSP